MRFNSFSARNTRRFRRLPARIVTESKTATPYENRTSEVVERADGATLANFDAELGPTFYATRTTRLRPPCLAR